MREEKASLRSRAKVARDALFASDRTRASELASRRVLELAVPRRRVALYAARGSEIDPRAVEAQLEREGALVVFPRVEGRELRFAPAWSRTLVPAGFGLLEPSLHEAAIDPAELDYILVPALLFARASGHRLGYGKGFFDRALGGLRPREDRPLFVGFGFEAQLVPELPRDEHDVPVDLLVTEATTILYSALARARLGSLDSSRARRP